MLPDPELLRKLSLLWSNGHTPKDDLGTPNLELVHIIDFFLALSICNSVVVSSPHCPQPMVSLVIIQLKFKLV